MFQSLREPLQVFSFSFSFFSKIIFFKKIQCCCVGWVNLWNIYSQTLKKTEFSLGHKKVVPRFLFCLDGKFLNCVLGMIGATETFFCPFCFIPNTMWVDVYAKRLSANDHLRKSLLTLSHCTPNCLQHPSKCRGYTHGCERDNLLMGLVELEDIFLDELHLFLYLWDLILNILLDYVEPLNQENALERVVKKCEVCFHMLDGLNDKGYQLWTPLTGD